MNQTKTCTKCNQTKELTEFYKQKRGKYGLRSICKCCDKLYNESRELIEYDCNAIKTCTKCNQKKSTTEFSKSKNGKFGVNSRCKSCDKQYYLDNTEHINARNKQYYADNTVQVSAKHKQYNADNAKHIAELRQENKEHNAARKKQWRLTPYGKAAVKASKHNRRAHKLNNGGKHTAKDILALFELQSGKCPYCKAKLCKSGKNKYHSDHIVPLSKFGSNDISNIQLLCAKCNLTKSDKLPEVFAANFNKLF